MKVKWVDCEVASTLALSLCACAADIIRLAVLLPMSGGWAVGPELIGALALAVRDVNDNPDILRGKRLEYVWADDGCSRTKSLLEFTDILGRYRIDGLIGPGCAKGCEVTATLANAKNIAQISPTCAAPSLSNKAEFPLFVRTTSPYAKWAPAIVALMKWASWTRLSFIGDVAMAESVGSLRAELARSGFKPGVDVQFDADRFEAKNLHVVLEAGVRVVMVFAYPADNVAIATEAKGLGMAWGWAFMGLDMVSGCEKGLQGTALKRAQEALHGWMYFEPSSAATQSFFDNVKAASISDFGQSLDGNAQVNLYSANLYDAVMLFALVAGRHLGKPSDGKLMVADMLNASFDGMTGKVALDDSGDMKESIKVLNYKLASDGRMHSSKMGVFDGISRAYVAILNATAIWPGGSGVPPMSLLACEVGMFLEEQRQCVACPAGTSSPGGTLTACRHCSAGDEPPNIRTCVRTYVRTYVGR